MRRLPDWILSDTIRVGVQSPAFFGNFSSIASSCCRSIFFDFESRDSFEFAIDLCNTANGAEKRALCSSVAPWAKAPGIL
jgi:hypothetical protein